MATKDGEKPYSCLAGFCEQNESAVSQLEESFEEVGLELKKSIINIHIGLLVAI